MKKLVVCKFVCVLMVSCHKRLDYGIVWDEQAARVQMTKDSLSVELEWYGDDAFMTATVKDRGGQILAIISRQSEDDICTIIKYLRNDTGAVRGFLVYPGCYPVADRSGNAKIKEKLSDELESYKNALWNDFYMGNHPNDIGLALVQDKREDRPYAARYYFRYDQMYNDEIRAIYDPITKQIIKSGDGYFSYDVKAETLEFSRDSLIGDVHLMFIDISNVDCGSHTYKTYCGYRPMEEFEFMSNRMFSHTVFRSDRPDPYATVELGWDDDGTRYTISRDYMEHDFATTYSDGIIKRVEEVSQWGTVLKREVYIDSDEYNTYSIQLLRYNYQTKQLEYAGKDRIEKATHRMHSNEPGEMILDSYLQEMWGRYAHDSYWDSFMKSDDDE